MASWIFNSVGKKLQDIEKIIQKNKSCKSSVTVLHARLFGKSYSCYSFNIYSTSVTIPLHIIIQTKPGYSDTGFFVSQV